MFRDCPQQGQRSVTGQHLLDDRHGLMPLDFHHIGQLIVDRQPALNDRRPDATQPQVLQLAGGQAHSVGDLGGGQRLGRVFARLGIFVLHAPMKALFAVEAKSMLQKYPPQNARHKRQKTPPSPPAGEGR